MVFTGCNIIAWESNVKLFVLPFVYPEVRDENHDSQGLV